MALPAPSLPSERSLAFVPSFRPTNDALDTASYVDGIVGNTSLYTSADDVLFEAATAVFTGDVISRQYTKRREIIAEPWEGGDVPGHEAARSDADAKAAPETNPALAPLVSDAQLKGPLELARDSLNEAFGELNVLLNLLPLIKGQTTAVAMSASSAASSSQQRQQQPQAASIALFDRSTIVGNPPPASWFNRQGERMLGYKQLQLEGASGLLSSAAERLKASSTHDYAESLLALKELGASDIDIGDWLVGLPSSMAEEVVDASIALTAALTTTTTTTTDATLLTFKQLRAHLHSESSAAALLHSNAALVSARQTLFSQMSSGSVSLLSSLTPHVLCLPPSLRVTEIGSRLLSHPGGFASLFAPVVMATASAPAASTHQVVIASEGLRRMLALSSAAEADSGSSAIGELTLLYPPGFSGARRRLVCLPSRSTGEEACDPLVTDVASAMAALSGYACEDAPSPSGHDEVSLAKSLASCVIAPVPLQAAPSSSSSGGRAARGDIDKRPIARVEAQVFELLSYWVAGAAWAEYKAGSAGGGGKLGQVLWEWVSAPSPASGPAPEGRINRAVWLESF